jgi:polysaccharide export outer membrane protein
MSAALRLVVLSMAAILAAGGSITAGAQQPAAAGQAPTSPALPPGYVIGADDVLSIKFWKDADMSVESVTVRPDGKISVPLVNDVQAAGLTPDELRAKLVEAAGKFVEDPNVTVIVTQVRSRNVFITGSVARPGPYGLINDLTVLQLIAMAGGLGEFADSKNIRIIRPEKGRPQYFKFNYKEVVEQKNPAQNIMLKPGDTIVVP